MNAQTLFLTEISKLKKYALRRTVARTLLVFLLFVTGCYTLAVGMKKLGIFPLSDLLAFYEIAAVISIAGTAIYFYFTSERLLALLIRIDKRLQLHDRLSTAYEYHQRGDRSYLSELLIDDAAQKLRQFSEKQLFPFRFSAVHRLLVILIAVNIAFAAMDYFSSLNAATAGIDPATAQKIKTALEKYTQKPRNDKKPARPEQQEQYRQLDNIIKDIEQHTMSRDGLQQATEKMLREIEADKSKIANDLASQLQDTKLKDLPMSRAPQLMQMSPPNMEQLKKMLDDMFDGKVPDPIQENMNQLNENQELQDLLDKLSDDLKSRNGDSRTSENGEPPSSPGKESGDQGNAPPDKVEQGAMQAEESQQGEEGKSLLGTGRGSTQKGERDSSKAGEPDENQSGSLLPGDGKSDGKSYDPYELERAKGATVEDKTASAKQEKYTVPIRSLTQTGAAKMTEEEIKRTYQQEVERILQQEDIPLNYREYIKNYFLAIGLREGGKPTNDSDQ